MKRFLAAALALVVTGCATLADSDQDIADSKHQITCQGRESCDELWSRASTWLVENSTLRIQSQSDYMISTYSSADQSTDLDFTVVRTATGSGTYEIKLSGGCSNLIGCFPSIVQAKARFYRFVTSK